jgi:post-segregation antitoxin (ccd killing protein)
MKIISVRLPADLEQTLAERKENCSLNISAFVCKAIRRELERPIVEADPKPTVLR